MSYYHYRKWHNPFIAFTLAHPLWTWAIGGAIGGFIGAWLA